MLRHPEFGPWDRRQPSEAMGEACIGSAVGSARGLRCAALVVSLGEVDMATARTWGLSCSIYTNAAPLSHIPEAIFYVIYSSVKKIKF